MISFVKIGIYFKSIAGPLPSVVQAYTQTYSFGGRINLIICQIRHELSVTIYEISNSWKKKLDGGPYTLGAANSYLCLSHVFSLENITIGKSFGIVRVNVRNGVTIYKKAKEIKF